VAEYLTQITWGGPSVAGANWERRSKTLAPCIEAYAGRYLDQSSSPEGDDNGCSVLQKHALTVLKELCVKAWMLDVEKGLAVVLSTQAICSVLKAAVLAEDWKFFEDAALRTGGSVPIGFFEWARDQIAEGRIESPEIKNGMLEAALSLPDINRRYSALSKFVYPEDGEDAQAWFQEAMKRILGRTHSKSEVLGDGDGESLARMAKRSIGSDLLTADIMPLAERNISKPSFILSFLNELHKTPENFAFPGGKWLFWRLAKQAIEKLDISKIRSEQTAFAVSIKVSAQQKDAERADAPSSWQTQLRKEAVCPSQLAGFISTLLSEPEYDNLLMRLAIKIVNDSDFLDKGEFIHFWLPFLRSLITVLEKHQIPLSTPRYHHIFAAILETYAFKCVGYEPDKYWLPASRTLTCCCNVCMLTGQFLASDFEAGKIQVHAPHEVEHVRIYLNSPNRASIRCTFEIDSNIVTPGWVVARKLPTYVDEQAHARWAAKVDVAKSEFTKFDSTKLQTILGNEYTKVLEMEVLKAPKNWCAVTAPEETAYRLRLRQGTGTGDSSGLQQPPLPGQQQPAKNSSQWPGWSGSVRVVPPTPQPPVQPVHHGNSLGPRYLPPPIPALNGFAYSNNITGLSPSHQSIPMGSGTFLPQPGPSAAPGMYAQGWSGVTASPYQPQGTGNSVSPLHSAGNNQQQAPPRLVTAEELCKASEFNHMRETMPYWSEYQIYQYVEKYWRDAPRSLRGIWEEKAQSENAKLRAAATAAGTAMPLPPLPPARMEVAAPPAPPSLPMIPGVRVISEPYPVPPLGGSVRFAAPPPTGACTVKALPPDRNLNGSPRLNTAPNPDRSHGNYGFLTGNTNVLSPATSTTAAPSYRNRPIPAIPVTAASTQSTMMSAAGSSSTLAPAMTTVTTASTQLPTPTRVTARDLYIKAEKVRIAAQAPAWKDDKVEHYADLNWDRLPQYERDKWEEKAEEENHRLFPPPPEPAEKVELVTGKEVFLKDRLKWLPAEATPGQRAWHSEYAEKKWRELEKHQVEEYERLADKRNKDVIWSGKQAITAKRLYIRHELAKVPPGASERRKDYADVAAEREWTKMRQRNLGECKPWEEKASEAERRRRTEVEAAEKALAERKETEKASGSPVSGGVGSSIGSQTPLVSAEELFVEDAISEVLSSNINASHARMAQAVQNAKIRWSYATAATRQLYEEKARQKQAARTTASSSHQVQSLPPLSSVTSSSEPPSIISAEYLFLESELRNCTTASGNEHAKILKSAKSKWKYLPRYLKKPFEDKARAANEKSEKDAYTAARNAVFGASLTTNTGTAPSHTADGSVTSTNSTGQSSSAVGANFVSAETIFIEDQLGLRTSSPTFEQGARQSAIARWRQTPGFLRKQYEDKARVEDEKPGGVVDEIRLWAAGRGPVPSSSTPSTRSVAATGPSTPSAAASTTAVTANACSPGFKLFCDQLEPGLRRASPNSSDESIRFVLQKRWAAMSQKHRDVYVDEARQSGGSSTAEMSSAIDLTEEGVSAPSGSSPRVSAREINKSGFDFFLNEEGPKLLDDNPRLTKDQISLEMSRKWSRLNRVDRAQYEAKAKIVNRNPSLHSHYSKLDNVIEEKQPKASSSRSSSSAVDLTASAPSDSSSNTSLELRKGAFGACVNSLGVEVFKKNPTWTYEQVFNEISRRWSNMGMYERDCYEAEAKSMECFPDEEHAFYTKLENAIKAKQSQTTAATSSASRVISRTATSASSSSSSPVPSGTASRGSLSGDGKTGFDVCMNTLGIEVFLKNPTWTYDQVRKEISKRWDRMLLHERDSYEEQAENLKKSPRDARGFYSKLQSKIDARQPNGSASSASSRPSHHTSNSRAISNNRSGLEYFIVKKGHKLLKDHPNFTQQEVLDELTPKWLALSKKEKEVFEAKAVQVNMDRKAANDFFGSLGRKIIQNRKDAAKRQRLAATAEASASSSTPSRRLSSNLATSATTGSKRSFADLCQEEMEERARESSSKRVQSSSPPPPQSSPLQNTIHRYLTPISGNAGGSTNKGKRAATSALDSTPSKRGRVRGSSSSRPDDAPKLKIPKDIVDLTDD